MKVRVHILYKQAEIRANTTIPAIVVSVTYRKHDKLANTGSPLALPTLLKSYFYKTCVQGETVQVAAKRLGQGLIPFRFRAVIPPNS